MFRLWIKGLQLKATVIAQSYWNPTTCPTYCTLTKDPLILESALFFFKGLMISSEAEDCMVHYSLDGTVRFVKIFER
jgi:hypothetical protein